MLAALTDVAALLRGVSKQNFNENEPRDDHGQWTEGGGLAAVDGDWTEAERHGVIAYTTNGFRGMNQRLRGDQYHAIYPLGAVDELTAAIDRSTTTRDATVYRGLTEFAFNRHFADLHVGDIVQDAGFTSTTRHTSVAESFTYPSGVIVEIQVPKGTHALPMEQVPDMPSNANRAEQEVILQRGTRYRVDAISGRGASGKVHLTAVGNQHGDRVYGAATALRKSSDGGSRFIWEAGDLTGPHAQKQNFNENEPRDDHGQWTDSGRAGLSALVTQIGQPDGGFTYQPATADQPTHGYAVSIYKGREVVLDAKDVTVEALAKYAVQNWDLLQQGDNHFGGWHNPDDGKVYLDVSRVVRDAGEANRLAAAHDQIAYFDLHAGKSIPTTKGDDAKEADTRTRGRTQGAGHAGRLDRDVQAVDGQGADAGGSGERAAAARREGVKQHFDPNEPRDDHGRWTDGDGYDADYLASPSDAIEALALGDHVTIAPENLRGLLDRAALRDDHPDLTNLSVDGTPIFGGGLGYARTEMPQIPSAHRDAFVQHLHDQGITTKKQLVAPMSLRPSQNEIDAQKVGEGLRKFGDMGSQKPIFISKDSYVLDGHHRWAQSASLSVEPAHKHIKLAAIRINANHTRALELMHAYDKAHGIEGREHGKLATPWRVKQNFDPNEARDDLGRWANEGGPAGDDEQDTSITEQRARELQAQSEAAQKTMDALVAEAAATADFDNVPGMDEDATSWSDLSEQLKSDVESAYIDDKMDDARDNATESVRQEKHDEFADDPAILRAATAALIHDIQEREGVLIDPSSVTLTHVPSAAGPILASADLRTMDGQPLHGGQQISARDAWVSLYASGVLTATENYLESSEGQSLVDDRAHEIAKNVWDVLDYSDSYDYAKAHFADQIAAERGSKSVAPGIPSHWKVTPDSDYGDADYLKTGAVAKRMAELRTEQLLVERGLSTTADPADDRSKTIPADVWENWKTDSHSRTAMALQLAVANEFGGLHRLTTAQVQNAMAAAASFDYDTHDMDKGLARLQAYARAQWETTQYVLAKAGVKDMTLYRGLMLDGDTLPDARPREVSSGSYATHTFDQLTDLQLKRNGLQSTTLLPKIANEWNGIGHRQGDQRVVLRMQIPRTSILSIPVFGQNVQSEQEVVVAGFNDVWKWDAWLEKAPHHDYMAIKSATRKTAKLVIDLWQIEIEQPYWLSQKRNKPTSLPSERKVAKAVSMPADDRLMFRALAKQAEDQHEPDLARTLRHAWTEAAHGTPAQWRAAVQGKNWDALSDLFRRGVASVKSVLEPRLASAYLRGVRVGARPLERMQIPVRAMKADLRLNLGAMNALAADWARERAAVLVGADADTKALIRDFVTQAVEDGFTVDETAKLIEGVIGLDARRALAVERYATDLLETQSSTAAVQEALDRYAERALRDRAETIARTEIMMATNAGQHALWQEAASRGMLDGLHRIWIQTDDERCCDACDALADQPPVALDEPFDNDGDAVLHPPLHPRCRCTVGLVRAADDPHAAAAEAQVTADFSHLDALQAALESGMTKLVAASQQNVMPTLDVQRDAHARICRIVPVVPREQVPVPTLLVERDTHGRILRIAPEN